MEKTIEQLVLQILNQVSSSEKSKNKALERRTAKVLKTLEYVKAVSGIDTGFKRPVGV